MGIESARILLAAPSAGARSIIKTILINMGFNNIVVGSNFDELADGVQQFNPDLLIFDSGFSQDEIYELVKNIRHNIFGFNPFLTVIALSNEPTEKVVKGVMRSGVDDLLIQPYSTGQFIERINVLVKARKPFVVTSDYIGPDRRKVERRGEGEVIPLITVPNALKECSNNKMDRERFTQIVRSVSEEINIMRLNRNGLQVVWLADSVLENLHSEKTNILTPMSKIYLERIIEVVLETLERAEGTIFNQVSHICDALIQHTKNMLYKNKTVTKQHEELLKELSQAFCLIFKKIDAEKLAEQIHKEVEHLSSH